MRSRLRTAAMLAVAVTLLATGVQAATNPIQPGDSTSNCTLDFVYDNGAGDVFVGIAGHCVSNGDRVMTFGHGEFGTVVYDDGDKTGGLDIALIEVDEDKESLVDASVKGNPNAPTGVADWTQTGIGDQLGISGYGVATQFNSATRENRTGPLIADNTMHYCSDVPATFGDSGGPIFHVSSGKALGIVSRISPFECVGTLTGPTVQGFLDELDRRGWDLSLRTV